MHRRKSFALLGAIGTVSVLALSSLGSTAAGKSGARSAAAGTPVTVRIEGDHKTLLPATEVRVLGRAVKREGHSCRGTTAAEALQLATHGRWSGKWYSGLGFEVFKIFGENDVYSTTHTWWDLFINNVASSAGICGTRVHRGDQVLLAAVPAKGTEYPLVLRDLTKPIAGKPFTVRVVFVKGRTLTPLAGATVTAAGTSAGPGSGGSVTAKTNSRGIATLTAHQAGLVELGASKDHYIRAAAVAEDVAS